MNLPAITAAVFLLLIVAPTPLLWLDALFHRWLVRRVVGASGGRVDSDSASERIRFAEGIEPRQSAVLFAGMCLVGAAGARVTGAAYSPFKSALVLVLAVAALAMGAIQERYSWARAASFVAGATSVVAML